MPDDKKAECIESIIRAAESGATWRTGLAIKFDDRRCKRAAALLSKFAEEAVNLNDDQWKRLAPHYSWVSGKWRIALSETVRAVGFSLHSNCIETFIETLIQRLSSTTEATA